jgi:hydroxymethylbilane synthase
VLARRPDVKIVTFRGNVETRLRMIDLGVADATLLASAGLDRLGHGEVGVVLDDLLPAPAQGAVGVEVRAGDGRVAAFIHAIDDRPTHDAVRVERRLLAGLGGSCRSPVAALARIEGADVHLRAEILSPDGRESQSCDVRFPLGDEAAPDDLARQLLGRASPALRSLFGP